MHTDKINSSTKKINVVVTLLLVSSIVFFAICLLPQTREVIISFFENFILHRPVKSFSEKMAWLLLFSKRMFVLCFAIFVLWLFSFFMKNMRKMFL